MCGSGGSQTRALREVYRVFRPRVCVCVCVRAHVCLQREAPQHKPANRFRWNLANMCHMGWECACLSFVAKQPPVAMQRPKNRVLRTQTVFSILVLQFWMGRNETSELNTSRYLENFTRADFWFRFSFSNGSPSKIGCLFTVIFFVCLFVCM